MNHKMNTTAPANTQSSTHETLLRVTRSDVITTPEPVMAEPNSPMAAILPLSRVINRNCYQPKFADKICAKYINSPRKRSRFAPIRDPDLKNLSNEHPHSQLSRSKVTSSVIFGTATIAA
jgi:hypothetical protein